MENNLMQHENLLYIIQRGAYRLLIETPNTGAAQMIEAHYTVTTAVQKRANPLIKGVLRFAITQNGHREWFNNEEPVTGKVDAREFCAKTGYTPWNF